MARAIIDNSFQRLTLYGKGLNDREQWRSREGNHVFDPRSTEHASRVMQYSHDSARHRVY